MRRDPLERLSIRAALAMGFGLVLSLWLFTGYALSTGEAIAEAQTSEVTSRYMRAQDALSAIRLEINVSSIVLRDALLDPSQEGHLRHRRRLEEAYGAIADQLEGYRPVGGTEAQSQLARLREEVAGYRQVVYQVLAESRSNPSVPPSALLARHIAPRRAAAIAVSEEIRAVNRAALVEHHVATAAIHRAAERRWWYGVGAALTSTLLIALLAIVYAGRLERRLRIGRERDAAHARDLQRLSARLIEVQEEERRSIARELHDEVGQVLSAISVEAQLAERGMARTEETSRRALAEVQQLADSAIRTVRDLSQLLRPTMLDDLGLGAAIDWLLRGLARRHAVQVELVQSGGPDRLPARVEVVAFRIVQEALTNVARHARAGRCTVRVHHGQHQLVVTVEDDGVGFDPTQSGSGERRPGLGLVGMRERALDLGGAIEVHSRPDDGTCVTVTLPIAAPAPHLEPDGHGVSPDLAMPSTVHG